MADISSSSTAPVSDATISSWLTAALRGAGRVGPDDRVTWTLTTIGTDRGMTSRLARAAWHATPGERTGTAVLKVPAPSHDFERSCREVRFYEHIGASTGVRVPEAIACTIDDAAQRVMLLLEDVAGTDGDAAAGCSGDRIASIVAGLACMHARWWRHDSLQHHAWLPRWGRGVAGVGRPHVRRAARYQRRVEPFLDRFGADATPQLVRLIRMLADAAERVLARVAVLPPTLVHADVHLDNVIFVDAPPPADFVLLDWQSVSSGPGSYDLARLLVDGLRDRDAHARIPTMVDTYFDALATAGVPAEDLDAMRAAWPAMLACVLIGFVSGYGGRNRETLSDREIRMIRRSLSADGIGGVVPDAMASVAWIC